jgi:hypothetical protein
MAEHEAARAILDVGVVGQVEDLLALIETPAAEDREQGIPVEARGQLDPQLDVDLLQARAISRSGRRSLSWHGSSPHLVAAPAMRP